MLIIHSETLDEQGQFINNSTRKSKTNTIKTM